MAKITNKEEKGQGIFLLEMADDAWKGLIIKPGQFCHIQIPDRGHILRRPIGVMDFDADQGKLLVAIQRAGTGTDIIGEMEIGDTIDALLPLGNSFELDGAKKVIILGGGVGIAPMLYCEKYYRNMADIRAIWGFGSQEHIFCGESSAMICTEDGSCGIKGFVTDPLEEEILRDRPDVLWACGATPMLKAIISIAEKHDVPCKISGEQRMGCGMGACLCCSTMGKDGHYRNACTDGPVFDAKEVVLGG